MESLECQINDITSLDLSQNVNLTKIYCDNNQLEVLNLKNGNNSILVNMESTNNPNLSCIQVDDVDYANNQPQWIKSSNSEYNEDCNYLSISDNDNANFKMYPNPVHTVLYLETNNNSIDSVTIYSIDGSVVLNEIENSPKGINVSGLDQGIYFANVKINGKSRTSKFIKN